MGRKFFVGGNFKMNPISLKENGDLARNLSSADLDSDTEVVIAPPALYLLPAAEIISQSNCPRIQVAAQNCYCKASGAYTGEISPAQLADAGITYVILGHSERRTHFNETSQTVAEKTRAALAANLSVILCIGETLAQREANNTVSVVEEQLAAVVDVLKPEDWSRVVIAYEPVWAIGTGKVATTAQAQEVHAAIRSFLDPKVSSAVSQSTRVIYGGSVNAKNCVELATQPDIDGFLVGGASLKPEFIEIVNVNRKRN